MATTVIDSLVVELGMDTRKLKEGEREGLVSIEEFKRRLATVGETAQGGAEKLNNLFTVLRGGIFGLVAALGLGAIASFVEKVMQMDAQTSRLSRSLSVSTRELSIWQGVLKQVGGTAESANSLFETLADSLADIRLGISTPSGPFAFVMSRMGLDIRRSTPEQIMERIPEFVRQERAAGRQDVDIRALLKQIPGMNDPAIFAAMHGDFAAMRKAIETIGPLQTKQGEAAEKLAAKQSLLDTAVSHLASTAFPALNTAVEALTNTFVVAIGKFAGVGIAVPDGGPAVSVPGAGAAEHDTAPIFGDSPAPGPALGGGARSAAVQALARRMGTFSTDPAKTRGGINRGITGGTPHSYIFVPIPRPDPRTSIREGGTTINVAAINVTSTRADPKKVAEAIPEALHRNLAMVMPFNAGLT